MCYIVSSSTIHLLLRSLNELKNLKYLPIQTFEKQAVLA